MSSRSTRSRDAYDIAGAFPAALGLDQPALRSRARAPAGRPPHETEGEVRVPVIPPSMRIVPCPQATCPLAAAPAGPARPAAQSGRDYGRWVQRTLNLVMGLRLAVDGIIGPRTRSAIRSFQQKEGLLVTGEMNQQTERRLIERSGSPPPQQGVQREVVSAAAVSAGAAAVGAGIQLVKFGFDVIRTVVHGDIRFDAPQSTVGIRAVNQPPSLPLQARHCDTLIIDFEDVSPIGIEQVNVKLRCKLQYDGINLAARFVFDPAGRRSRLMRDTLIRIHDALPLERRNAPPEWQRCGITEYGVLRVPVELRVDRPWPLSNYNENFTLVLSSMFGFGATASDRQHIKEQRVAWT